MSVTTRVSRYQKGKTHLDFTGARDSEWQWHQLGHMQVCTSLQTDNHASTPPLSFIQAECPSCRPTNSVKALKPVTLSSVDMVDNLQPSARKCPRTTQLSMQLLVVRPSHTATAPASCCAGLLLWARRPEDILPGLQSAAAAPRHGAQDSVTWYTDWFSYDHPTTLPWSYALHVPLTYRIIFLKYLFNQKSLSRIYRTLDKQPIACSLYPRSAMPARVLAMPLCPSVCHKSVFYRNG